MSGDDIIRAAFAPIAGLPCWQVLGEFGTYLTFHFGTPAVHVHEPSEAIHHRRLAGVDGQYVLRIEAYQWVAFQDGGRLAQSESPRQDIRHAAAMLQGQKLLGFSLRTAPAGGEFVFDLGGRVAYQWKDPTETGDLWTFSTRIDPDDVDIISFGALAKVRLFTRRGDLQNTAEHSCEGGWLPVQLNALPDGGPATPVGDLGVAEGPPSVS